MSRQHVGEKPHRQADRTRQVGDDLDRDQQRQQQKRRSRWNEEGQEAQPVPDEDQDGDADKNDDRQREGDDDVAGEDRKSVVEGKSVSVRVDLGGSSSIKKKKTLKKDREK